MPPIVRPHGLDASNSLKNQRKPVYSPCVHATIDCKQSNNKGAHCPANGKNRVHPAVPQGPGGDHPQAEHADGAGRLHVDPFRRPRQARCAFPAIREALARQSQCDLREKSDQCGWGEWSLVQATLYAAEAAVRAFPRATHFYMLSGDCAAIKSARYAHDFLDAGMSITSKASTYFESDWIKTGMKEERLIYRHFFNERTRNGGSTPPTSAESAAADARDPRRYPGSDRQPVVVPAPPHDGVDH